MASKDDVLARVEVSSYLVALAVLTADNIVKSINVKDLPDAHEHDTLLLALVIALNSDILPKATIEAQRYAETLGYGTLSDAEAAQVAQEAITKVVSSAAPRLDSALTELENRIAEMSASGLDPETIHVAIEIAEHTLEGLFSGVRAVVRSAASGIVTGVETSVLEASLATYEMSAAASGESVQWDWVTMQDGNVCSDAFENSCAPRHGQIASLDEWAGYGLPKAPNLLCSIFSRGGNSNCRCVMVKAGTFKDIGGGAINASEAIAAGKARAQTEWAA